MRAERGGATASADTVDAYIAGFPSDVQKILRKIRRTIRSAAPGAQEAISYRIPSFRLNGRYLVYFAGLLDQPVPFDLITRVVRFKVKQSELAAAARATRKRRPAPREPH